jgi:putative sensor protein/putative autotransporter adhesin-like protein
VSVWLSRFAGVVLRGQTWLNVGYLLLAFPTGLAYFIVLVIGLSLGAALAVLVIGLGILIVTLAAWRAMAAIERGLARGMLGVPILENLQARTARVTVQAAGDAKLNVSDRLDVTVQGAGDVTYRGDPDLHQTVEGAGDVHSED